MHTYLSIKGGNVIDDLIQTAGDTGRVNWMLEPYLRIYTKFEQDNWAMLLCDEAQYQGISAQAV
jgi:hypothetical protein